MAYEQLPAVPDHTALEKEILAWWDREGIFDKLREQNSGGERFGFLDGPITANNPMGVHHAWGRTLKDVFQRYKALRGFDQRYQNGFDCQGLWVEVEVEKALGLNSKRDIEEYGLAEFAARCRERVAEFAEVITDQDRRLGRWMDWDNDYYTFSDTNIEYIWRFLKAVHERGWLYKGHRSTQWCPRCGTSLSQHEQAGEANYKELEHPSLFVRFPLKEREGEALVVWTTTPWTLPANVAAAVKPDAEYGLRDGHWRLAEEKGEYDHVARGEELVGLEYEGPFDDDARRRSRIVHRIIPWDEVSLDEGTGIVHIAPGAGTEDFELGRASTACRCSSRSTSPGRMLPGFGRLEGLSTDEVEDVVIEDLRERELLVESGRITHRYPICWRCKTPLVFRVVDDWFISCDEVRQPMLDANATVEWTPSFYSKRMDDWLRNMGDWNISRKRYFGLPLPFYPCDCGELNVVGSRAELEERATGGLDQLQELHRPWIDEVTIACAACGKDVRRIAGGRRRVARRGHRPVLDARLAEPRVDPGRLRDRRGEGPVRRGPARPRVLGAAGSRRDWISESASRSGSGSTRCSFMSVTLDGRVAVPSACSTYEKRPATSTGARCTSRLGNAIEADEAIERMGADVMRWHVLRAESEPERQFRLRAGARDQAPAADALELGQVLRRLRERLAGRRAGRAGAARPLAPLARRAARRRGRRTRTSATGRPT